MKWFHSLPFIENRTWVHLFDCKQFPRHQANLYFFHEKLICRLAINLLRGNLQADLIFVFCISVFIIPQKSNMSAGHQFALKLFHKKIICRLAINLPLRVIYSQTSWTWPLYNYCVTFFFNLYFKQIKSVFCKLYIEITLLVGGVINSFDSSNLLEIIDQ